MPLVEQLGHPADARLLIVTCDNLGAFHSANVAAFDAVRDGIATGASLTVPAPWAREAVRSYRGAPVGVRLSLNNDFDCYRWSSISRSPSLHSGEGGFPRGVDDLWEHADAEEVRRECRAQIERAIVWGFSPSHLCSHLDALVFRPELFDVYLDLALEFRLPVRLASPEREANAGFPVRDLVADANVVTPDQSLRLDATAGAASFTSLLESLPAGVTELVVEPATDTPELAALTPDAAAHIGDHALLVDPATAAAVSGTDIRLISWVDLCSLQQR